MEFLKDKKLTATIDVLQINGKPKTIENKCKTKEKNMKKIKKPSFTCKQRVSLGLLASVDFMSFCAMSILAPFYPKEAGSKGMSETVAGFVFSFYALVMFIFSPIFGKIIPRVGIKLVFIGGILISGGCSIIFGLLEYVEDNITFTILSFAIRGLEALGSSAYSTAGYVLVTSIFPEHAATVRGILETFVGIGMSVGPGVGGLLFAVGGYGVPFYVVGILTILLAPLNMFLLQSGDDCNVDKKSGSMLGLLRLPATLVICGVIVVVSITWSFLDPTLEPALRKYNLSSANIGLIFLLLSATYGITCPVCGWFVDKMTNYWPLMSGGLIFSAISLLFLGPSPVLTFLEDSLLLNIISLCALGVAVGVSLMPTFQALADTAIEGGLGEGIGTNSVVAGLWACVYSLGEVIGPAMGGALLEHFGFPLTATFMAALNFLAAIGMTMFFCLRKKSCDMSCDSKEDEVVSKDQGEESISITNGKYVNSISNTIMSERL